MADGNSASNTGLPQGKAGAAGARQSKKAYATPRLEVFGNLAEVTRAGGMGTKIDNPFLMTKT